jgi:predicted small secreted protein
MDDRKRLGIFIIGTALIIVIVIAVFMYMSNQKQKAANTVVPVQTELDPNKLREEALNNKPESEYSFDSNAEKNRVWNSEDLRKMALSFAERFGSYSNQANYGNIEDLKIFMTPKMQDWADSYVAGLRQQDKDSSVYYGIFTTAITGEVKRFDDKAGTAEILVATQRREMAGTSEAKVFSQNVLIVFEKIKGEWKASSATWQK